MAKLQERSAKQPSTNIQNSTALLTNRVKITKHKSLATLILFWLIVADIKLARCQNVTSVSIIAIKSEFCSVHTQSNHFGDSLPYLKAKVTPENVQCICRVYLHVATHNLTMSTTLQHNSNHKNFKITETLLNIKPNLI